VRRQSEAATALWIGLCQKPARQQGLTLPSLTVGLLTLREPKHHPKRRRRFALPAHSKKGIAFCEAEALWKPWLDSNIRWNMFRWPLRAKLTGIK